MLSSARPDGSNAGTASLTQLPPSPEISSLAHEAPPNFSLGGAAPITIEDSVSRLRSAANYKAFHPQAIACSPPTFLSDGKSFHQPGEEFSSLGAIAGDNGIVLFRTSRPDAPLLVLSHSSMSSSRAGNNQTGGIQNLAFEPVLVDSVLLAASRGNGLLIWDASGHSLSPLMGRLAVESTESSHDAEIRSIAWKHEGAHSTVATSTTNYTAIWDLRVSLGAKTSKPSLRFGAVQNTSPLIQVACSHKGECATMDSAGFIRVYDLRMTGRKKPSVLTSFSSFHFAGVGLTSFRTSADESYWMATGLDAPKADAVVKVWSIGASTDTADDAIETDSDTYWHMDGSADRSPIGGSTRISSATASQVAQFTMPYLACARVCPAPFENSVVTVGLAKNGGSGFRAELWKLNVGEDDDASDNTDTFGVERIVSFTEDGASNLGITSGAGSLRGAELALSQAPIPLARGPKDKEDEDWELLLCCMSQEGLVTTSVVADAPSQGIKPSSNHLHPLFASRSLRYFPNERRGSSTLDAASALKSIGDSGHGRNPLDDTRHSYVQQDIQNTPLSPPTMPDRGVDAEPIKKGDTSAMPFDMDVGFVPIVTEQATASTVAGPESENAELNIQQSRTVKRVVTDRVPCPRLCGATFSAGVGGLICFNNGEINKMWSWYQKSESRRKSSGLRSSADKSDGFSRYPRLKKDLDDMIKAAKDAQWGENDDDPVSEDNESEDSIDDLFEDLSSEEEGDAPTEMGQSDDMKIYETYFGGKQKPVTLPKSTEESEDSHGNIELSVRDAVLEAEERRHQAPSFDGPSSDVLTPIVLISYNTNRSVFNGQSVELAENLLLGDWMSHESGDIEEEASTPEMRPSTPTTVDMSDSNFRSPTRGSKTPPRTESRTLTQVLSDPLISSSSIGEPPLLMRDDDPVHGGEYAVRPRREESLRILQKLVPKPYQSLMSPPDSHMLPNTLELQMKRSSSSNAIMQTMRASMAAKLDNRLDSASTNSSGEKATVGVYTARAQNNLVRQKDPNASLKLICIHNSNVCTEYGEIEKANTWSILAQAVDNHLDGEIDSFNGWGGTSLALDLVSSLLQYYEGEGDIQMVATMVCVLSAGQRTATTKNQRSVSLLSLDQNAKYDLHIQLYAELVYRWGLSSKRVELHKHLSRTLSTADVSLARIETSDATTSIPGISFAISCPRCKTTSTTSDGNVCSTCSDYGFRCIMCANAVRGLFTVCSLCGHGGHLEHIMNWFENETKCPSGCGCSCVFTAPLDSSQASKALPNEEEEPELLVQRLPYSDIF
jgi:hypothetical protein